MTTLTFLASTNTNLAQTLFIYSVAKLQPFVQKCPRGWSCYLSQPDLQTILFDRMFFEFEIVTSELDVSTFHLLQLLDSLFITIQPSIMNLPLDRDIPVFFGCFYTELWLNSLTFCRDIKCVVINSLVSVQNLNFTLPMFIWLPWPSQGIPWSDWFLVARPPFMY